MFVTLCVCWGGGRMGVCACVCVDGPGLRACIMCSSQPCYLSYTYVLVWSGTVGVGLHATARATGSSELVFDHCSAHTVLSFISPGKLSCLLMSCVCVAHQSLGCVKACPGRENATRADTLPSTKDGDSGCMDSLALSLLYHLCQPTHQPTHVRVCVCLCAHRLTHVTSCS